MKKFNELIDMVELNRVEEIGFVKKVSIKTGIERQQIVKLIISITLLLVLLEIGSDFITDCIGFIYPSYKSFKVLETNDSSEIEIWMSYWVIYTVLGIYRITVHQLSQIVPLFPLIRLILYIYLMHPKTKVIRQLIKNISRIERSMQNRQSEDLQYDQSILYHDEFMIENELTNEDEPSPQIKKRQ